MCHQAKSSIHTEEFDFKHNNAKLYSHGGTPKRSLKFGVYPPLLAKQFEVWALETLKFIGRHTVHPFYDAGSRTEGEQLVTVSDIKGWCHPLQVPPTHP